MIYVKTVQFNKTFHSRFSGVKGRYTSVIQHISHRVVSYIIGEEPHTALRPTDYATRGRCCVTLIPLNVHVNKINIGTIYFHFSRILLTFVSNSLNIYTA